MPNQDRFRFRKPSSSPGQKSHARHSRAHQRDLGRTSGPVQGRQIQTRHQTKGTSFCQTAHESDIRLVSNAYQLVANNSRSVVYEYELIVEPSQGCRYLIQSVLNKTSVARSLRELLLNSILPDLVDGKSPKGSVLIDPRFCTIYSLFKLIDKRQNHGKNSHFSPEENEFKFERLLVPSGLIDNLCIDLIIKYYTSYELNNSNRTVSIINSIVHHQPRIDMLKYGSVYYLFDNSLDKSTQRLDLISQQLLGISISGARPIKDNQNLVVINCSYSYMTQAYKLIDLLATFVEGRPISDFSSGPTKANLDYTRYRAISKILTSISVQDQEFQSFCSILSGYKCQSKTLNGDNINLRFHLTDLSANEILVDETTTVFEHLLSRGIKLIYPNLPCLKSRSTTPVYYPFELCTLMPGQKVPVFRLSSQAKNQFYILNKPQPTVSWVNSLKARDELAMICRDQLEKFGLSISQASSEAMGNILVKPVLQYKNQSLFPPRDFWESTQFYQPVDLVDNWCLVDTVGLTDEQKMPFFYSLSDFAARLGVRIGRPSRLCVPKSDIMKGHKTIESIIEDCGRMVEKDLKFIMFIIDSNSTSLNRSIHLSFDDNPKITATCIRSDNVLKVRQHRAIQRTLMHKLNSRLGGTNLTYNRATWNRLELDSNNLMIVGLDVTHPDNELNGVSIVGCAYTFSDDLFRHKSLVWPQGARKEIITRMNKLVERLLHEYRLENHGRLPYQMIIYRDGVSHEEFDRVRDREINKALEVIKSIADLTDQPRPGLSYIIAQKRHTTRFFRLTGDKTAHNPPGGTLIDKDVVSNETREFYLYSSNSPQATARPLHYHVLENGIGLKSLQKLTYYLCFNFGKCSMSLSMPSCLKYAHNAAYDARNRVIASREFKENQFYSTKFFC